MKLKGVNRFELIADKVLVGALAVILLCIVGAAFVLHPNMVKVGGKEVPPGEAYTPVETAAKTLAQKMAAESPAPPEPPKLTLASKLGAGFGADPGVRGTASLGPAVRVKGMDSRRTLAASVYALPALPAPADVAVNSFRSTIDPREVLRNPALAKVLPAEQPFDKAAVSIEARFDGTALRAALEADPDGSGPAEPLPLGWWRDPMNQGNDLVQVLAVEVQREMTRAPDGTTPADPQTETIVGMPGRDGVMTEWTKSVRSIGDATALIEQARYLQPQILHPAYYPAIAGPAWTPPSEVVDPNDAAARQRRIDKLRRDLTGVDESIDRLKKQLESAPAAGDREGDRRQSEPSAQPRTGGKGGIGSGGGEAQPRKGPTRTVNRAQIENRLKSEEAKRDRIVSQLKDLGVEVAAKADQAQGGGPNTPAPAEPPLLDNAEIKLIAHDLTPRPGAMYRYRVRVVLNNPVFGRNVQESQKAIAEPSVLTSPWSDWVNTRTEVERDEYVFVTSATPGGQDFQPRPGATAQLYKFYYGYYRQATVGLEPGDQLVGEAKLPDLKLADMNKLAERLKSDQPAAQPAGQPQLPTPPAGPGPRPGGGKGGAVGVAPPPPPERDRQPREPNAGQPMPLGPEVDWLNVPAPKTLTLSADAVYLDTEPVPYAMSSELAGGGGERYQAILRGVSGGLEFQRPDRVRNEELYHRVEASAREGVTQGAPVIKPIDEPKPPFGPRPRPQPTGPAEPGGGGGGGGGGG